MDLEFAAEDRDYQVFSASCVKKALDILEKHRDGIDTAVLDVTLQDGETCLPVARWLEKNGIPYVLHSGDLNRQNEKLRELSAPLIAKPASSDDVIKRAIGQIAT
ncbi:response regulator [Qipengyuania atrilutea]|uniref:Response regulator n=1 Tax=Qipengyuania atrilutea TaxID=2744473 RepID=A0A850H7J7_9SPHN|nr:response regulator [Actirhodobacter atriluteus]NVD45818.1 response regulator [Actirhodobacter atriluteus]